MINFCAETLKVNGSIPIMALPAIRYENVTLTSLTAGVVGEHTVVFAGTSDGHLRQVHDLLTDSVSLTIT